MERRPRFSRDCSPKTPRIVINVSGQRFETHMEWLQRFPDTLLGSETIFNFYDGVRKEYFFDRDPNIFRYILNYYCTGKLHASPVDCLTAFRDELDFFGISVSEVEECCWSSVNDRSTCNIRHHYAPRERARIVQTARNLDRAVGRLNNQYGDECSRRDNIEKNNIYVGGSKRVRVLTRSSDDKRRSNAKVESNDVHLSGRKFQHKFEAVENDPRGQKCVEGTQEIPSSKLHALLNCLYGIFIVLSIAVSAMETVDCSIGMKCEEQYSDTFFAIDTFFVAVFSLEFLIRLALSSNRRAFFKDFFNIVDLLAILPYYINLIFVALIGAKDELVAFRVLRVFRVMKLSRRSAGLQSLILTLRNCYTDLLFMYFTFTLGIILFASVLYYTEKDDAQEGFDSIPHSLWYTCVSMMTTGYGDVVPYTVLGKIIGGLCGICGVVIMSLPIPIMQDKKIMVEV